MSDLCIRPDITTLCEFEVQLDELYSKTLQEGYLQLATLIRCCIDTVHYEMNQINPPEQPKQHVSKLTNPEEIVANYLNVYEERASIQLFARALRSKDIRELEMWVNAIRIIDTNPSKSTSN